jgi:hypothetical protein
LFFSRLPILTGLPLEYTSTSLVSRESLKSEEERLLFAMVTPFGNLLLRISLHCDTSLHLQSRMPEGNLDMHSGWRWPPVVK